MPLRNNGGRDNPLGCPRRRAQRQATEAAGQAFTVLRAGTAQRAIPTNAIVGERYNPKKGHVAGKDDQKLGNGRI